MRYVSMAFHSPNPIWRMPAVPPRTLVGIIFRAGDRPSWDTAAMAGYGSDIEGAGMDSESIWTSFRDSLCSIPSTKSALRCACEAADTIIRGAFWNF